MAREEIHVQCKGLGTLNFVAWNIEATLGGTTQWERTNNPYFMDLFVKTAKKAIW